MKFSRFGFGSGLMSRDLAGRVDVDGVSRACVEMKNFELLQSGAVRRRFGSRWLADLSGRPVAMQAFRWSNGMLAVVVVLDAELIIFSEDGVKLFRCAYDSNGGIVRMRQINDLVIITNSNRLPVKLTNRGGVYDVAEIAWDHYPLEGSFNQSFPLSFSGVNFRVADAWDFCERGETGENTSDSGEEVVEVDRKTYSFGFQQYVKQHGYKLNNEYIIIVQYHSGKGVYYWEKASLTTGESEAYYNYFPSVTVAGGMTYRLNFPGKWTGTVIIEVSTDNGSSWKERTRFDGKLTELEETAERDTLLRFKFYEYSSNFNWTEQPVIEVFRRMTVTPSEDGDVIRAEYDGKMFCVGDVLAIRHKISERKRYFDVSQHMNGLSAANLKTTSYAVGKKLYSDISGIRKYWTCVKEWTADSTVASGADLDAWPSYFEPGIEFFRSVVSGEFEFGSVNKSDYNLWAVQTSSDGLRWENMITNVDSYTPNTEVILTGNNDGVPLLMRCVILEHDVNLAVSNMGKKYFKRKRFDLINYAEIVSLKDDGTGQVTLLNDPDMFDVRHCWEWDFFAFRKQNGFPVTCVLHAGRLVFGGTSGQPLTLWFSAVDDYFNFRTGDNTADAMLLTLVSSQQSELVWAASSGTALLCGTTCGEVAVRSIKADVLSSSSAVAEQHSNCGSFSTSDVLMTTDAIMFVDRSGKRLRRISYSMDSEFYFARDMTVFSYGVLSGGINGMVWQRAPEPVAWVVPESGEYAGKLMGMLYNPDQELASWFCWDFGGDVVGLACTATGRAVDELFFAVQRDGELTLEKMDWEARDYDCVGKGKKSVPFNAVLRTTQMDLPEFNGMKAVTPKVSVLMDEVDLTGAKCGCGAGSMQPFAVSEGNGWVNVVAPTDGQYKRALELSIARGHGLILAGAISND